MGVGVCGMVGVGVHVCGRVSLYRVCVDGPCVGGWVWVGDVGAGVGLSILHV